MFYQDIYSLRSHQTTTVESRGAGLSFRQCFHLHLSLDDFCLHFHSFSLCFVCFCKRNFVSSITKKERKKQVLEISIVLLVLCTNLTMQPGVDIFLYVIHLNWTTHAPHETNNQSISFTEETLKVHFKGKRHACKFKKGSKTRQVLK